MSYLHGHVHQKYLESPCEIKLLLHNSFFQNKKKLAVFFSSVKQFTKSHLKHQY